MGYSQLQIWLKSERNFQSGIKLLEEFEGSAALLSLLRSGENDFTRTKLVTALREIFEEKQTADIPAPHKSKPIPVSSEQKLSESKMPWIDVSALPEELKKLWILKNDITREQGHLHAQLELLPTKEERLSHALRILAIEEERAEMWKRLNDFQSTGKQPAQKQITILDLIAERDALGVRLSKHRKKPEYKEKVEQWTREREELTKRINDAAKPL